MVIIADIMTCQFRALSFDLDGTLAGVRWRRLGLWRGFLRDPKILGAYEGAVRALRGRRVLDWEAELVRELCARSGEGRARVEEVLSAQIGRAWPDLFAGAPVPAPVAALLRAADARGLPRVVVSDHPSMDKLARMGLGGWSAVIDCSALGALKPLPDGLWAAAATLGLRPREILHVGDRWDTDGLAAAAAGCGFLCCAPLRGGEQALVHAAGL